MTDLEFVKNSVAQNADETITISKKIWELAELSYQETGSAKVLCDALSEKGFTLEKSVADVPTSFIATSIVGTGKPVMGFLGEFDALDGLSQEAACTEKRPIKEGGCGHGCGHNLLGAGSFAAAVAVRDYLVANQLNGTVCYFGCPAEEGAGAKQFIARAGYFDQVDFVCSWHPSTLNMVQSCGDVAIMGANFTFNGIAAHAGGAPYLGRSALDAAELMNVGVNYLREHIIDAARVHYAYSDAGGTAPNVVQDHAVIKYEVRAPKVAQMQELFARVVNIAKGAALMTETKMDYEVTMAFSDYLPNKALAAVADACLHEVGAPAWDEEDYRLAKEFLRTYNKNTIKNMREEALEFFEPEQLDAVFDKPLDSVVHPFNAADKSYSSGSTDVGDVGYASPTINLLVATACIGNVGHSWQNTAFSNSAIGTKGMLTAAEALALTAIRIMEKPEVIAAAKAELKIKNGGHYTCPLPDYVKPPVGRY